MTTLRREHFEFDFMFPYRGAAYIECGAGFGDSLSIACCQPFQMCYGIEVSKRVCDMLRFKFIRNEKVHIYNGSSVDILPKLLDADMRTVFFIDSHYESGQEDSFDRNSGQCPLLKELAIIAGVPWKKKPLIMIDDYPAFMSDKEWWGRYASTHLNKSEWPRWSDIYERLGGVDWKYNFLASTNGILYCYP
jgi:hypothetical protein